VKPGRVVYSTGAGRLCAGCGWPADDCRCSKPAEEPVPARIRARLRLETKGRAGKSVTIVEELPRNTAFLDELAHDLKKACGTGGRVVESTVELQGDQRERVADLLGKRGWAIRS
jgi:translation initiation factor 1